MVDTDQSCKNDKSEKGQDIPLNKMLSPRKSIFRIFLAILAFIIWIFIGYYPNIMFTSGVQGLVGVFSFFVRNPVIFLIIALINIGMGAIYYILIGTIIWATFHFLWSIRWFYGFGKYSKLKYNYSS